MTWHDAVRSTREGVLLQIEVVPGAREERFPAGYNEWRKRLQARVRAPPVEGRANAALVELVARILNVPRGRIRIIEGDESRQKTLLVEGAAIESVLGALASGTTDN